VDSAKPIKDSTNSIRGYAYKGYIIRRHVVGTEDRFKLIVTGEWFSALEAAIKAVDIYILVKDYNNDC
jgi:hypothetical protein